MYKIYVIKNKVNDKIYIGQTKRSLKTRFIGHKTKSKCHSKTALHSAIKLYGIENFFIELIEECKTQEEVNEKEKFYIKEYNTLCPFGYNILKGGDSAPRPPAGPFTQEHKDKIKKAHTKNCKPICQFDIETGQLVKEWESGKEIKRAGYMRANIITLCKRESGFGYIYGSGWCYKEFYESIEDKNKFARPNYNAHGKTIKCLDKDGNLVKIYYKLVDAARELNCSATSISGCLKGREKYCKGFRWEYA